MSPSPEPGMVPPAGEGADPVGASGLAGARSAPGRAAPARRVDFRLYAITDRQRCAPYPLAEVVARLAEAGVGAVQVREKDLSVDQVVALAAAVVAACRPHGCRVLVNASVEAAVRLAADGVQLPASAPAVARVRAPAPWPLLVGCSVHSLEEALRRGEEGADFLTASPVYPTPSKPGYGPTLGLEGLRRICRAVSIPVFALAGVTPQRVAECLDQGAWGVAVMSGLMEPQAAPARVRAYRARIARHGEGRP
ncbi:MAG: thiamine phosphate synthase [Candidatus Latescibacterota bacterium]